MALIFKPKLDKILELLLYLAHARPNADIYQAVKFFYLADRAHLNQFARPITHEEYFALPYGPVASTAMDFLNRNDRVFKAAGIDELPFSTYIEKRNGKDTLVIGKPTRGVNFDLFSKSDIKIFDQIISQYGTKTFNELYDLTHSHLAYDRAWNDRKPHSKRAKMNYDEMIEDPKRRAQIINDFSDISQFIE